MKYLIQLMMFVLAIAVISLLQYKLWFGEYGHHSYEELSRELAKQQELIDVQKEANRVLIEDVKDLKNGLEAIEEHARLDLGYIKPGETFVQMSTSPTVQSSDNTLTEREVARYLESIPEPLETND